MLCLNSKTWGEWLTTWLANRHLNPHSATKVISASHMSIRRWMAGEIPTSPRRRMMARDLGITEEDLEAIIAGKHVDQPVVHEAQPTAGAP